MSTQHWWCSKNQTSNQSSVSLQWTLASDNPGTKGLWDCPTAAHYNVHKGICLFFFSFFSLFFPLKFYLVFSGRGWGFARVQVGWEGTSRWVGPRCMMWNPKRINKKLNLNKKASNEYSLSVKPRTEYQMPERSIDHPIQLPYFITNHFNGIRMRGFF